MLTEQSDGGCDDGGGAGGGAGDDGGGDCDLLLILVLNSELLVCATIHKSLRVVFFLTDIMTRQLELHIEVSHT